MLVNPTNMEIADAFGLMKPIPAGEVFDVAVVGGPAGSQPRSTRPPRACGPWWSSTRPSAGQAGTSSMIRNYPGFSQGISGAKLAQETWQQAWTLGTTFLYMRQARGPGAQRTATTGCGLSDGSVLSARSVVIATGAAYRRLGIPRLEDLQGRGVYYGAAVSEAPAMHGRNVFVVGGGNSAGQTALHMAKWAARVTVLVRGESLADSMSDYLVREIDAAPNVDVFYQRPGGRRQRHPPSRIADPGRHRPPGPGEASRRTPCSSSSARKPRTDWLGQSIARDQWGFILTGPDAAERR